MQKLSNKGAAWKHHTVRVKSNQSTLQQVHPASYFPGWVFISSHGPVLASLQQEPTRLVSFPDLIFSLQPLLQSLHLVHIRNLQYPTRLCLPPHQLLRARIQHPQLSITRRGNVRDQHVRDGEPAGGEADRVGQEDEARGIVWEVFGERGERCMGFVGGRVDCEGFAVDFVWLGGFVVLVGPKRLYSS